MPQCSFPEAVGHDTVQQNPGRMSLIRDKAAGRALLSH